MIQPIVKSFDDHGLHVHQQLPPDGWVVVDTYHPCSSVTPWDGYGVRHLREMAYVLKAAGIESMTLITSKVIIHPHGTGPHGSVRLGDNMTPGVYETAVKIEDENAACVAIAAHKANIQEWLKDTTKPLPAACCG